MPLTVSIHSFSYKKSGIPADPTGHGGGFIFDCRFIYNPGRQEEFKSLCGKDEAVIGFLQKQEKMEEFLRNVFSIIDPAIENYLERNFTSLMISFGCTGGQHRSVYAAERTREHIEEKFPSSETGGKRVKVEIYHNDMPVANSK